MTKHEQFSDLGETPTATRERCHACNGSGEWFNQRCQNCKGFGFRTVYEKTPEQIKKEIAEAKRMVRWREKCTAETKARYPVIYPYIESRTDNEFFNSLWKHLHYHGHLTPRQVAAVERAILRDQTRHLEELGDATAVASTDRLHKAFETAQESGLKRPALRVGPYKFYRAPATSANVGYLYVKHFNDYIGKISREGEYSYSRSATQSMRAEISKIAGNLLEAATAHGKATGQCSCCGRELTKADSVAAGIGPVCATKWGL